MLIAHARVGRRRDRRQLYTVIVPVALWLGLALTGVPGVVASAELPAEFETLLWTTPQAAVPGSGGLVRVSDKARQIAERLERKGYYRRLSRAYRGYPHLRAKRSAPSAAASGYVAGFDAEARQRLQSTLASIARTEKVDQKLLDAVITVESGYNAGAVSPKGAMGLMQLMPATAERFGVTEPFEPTANIRGGARYLRWLMDRFDGELRLVLAAYNAGEGAVLSYGSRVPPFPETQQYVQRVLKVYRGDDS